MTFHVEHEPIDLSVARLARQHPPPTYWQDHRGRWVAYVGRGIYELGVWERAKFLTHRRIDPREEYGS